MIKEKLYCPEIKHCYFLAFHVLNDLSNEANLDLVVSTDYFGKQTNVLVNPSNNKMVFSSDNPLKLVDFLKGYINGLKNIKD